MAVVQIILVDVCEQLSPQHNTGEEKDGSPMTNSMNST